MDNPNHSNERYRERDEKEIKRMAFDKKQGYKGSYAEHCKKEMNGMPEPRHMKGEY